MNVAIIVPSLGIGNSIETPTVRLFAEMMASHVGLHVFPVHYPTGWSSLDDAGFVLHPARSDTRRFAQRMFATIAAVRRQHQRTPFDLVHALWLHEPGTIGVAIGSLLRLPVIVSIGGAEVVALPDIAYGALRDRRGRLMTANVLQRATLVTGGSDYVLRRASRLIPHRDPSTLQHLPLPIDVTKFGRDSTRGYDPASPRLLHAASLIPVKDQAMLLRAFSLVAARIPTARLTIVGGDPYGLTGELVRLSNDLGIGGAVTFSGEKRHAEMEALYREADLLLMTSRHESQGMVVLEAGAAGIPTVGTAVGVVGDLAPDAAVAVPSRDPETFADAVADLLSDALRLRALGHAARAAVERGYDVSVMAGKTMALYREAVERGRR